jgi:hypothetical protein
LVISFFVEAKITPAGTGIVFVSLRVGRAVTWIAVAAQIGAVFWEKK